MENVSKAFLIAGAGLLLVVLFSYMLYSFNIAQKTQNAYELGLNEIEIQKINSNFEIFRNREDIRIHEIVSLIYKIQEYNNIKNDTIEVWIDNKNYIVENKKTIEKLLINQSVNAKSNIIYYKCKDIIYKNIGDTTNKLIQKITFFKKTED